MRFDPRHVFQIGLTTADEQILATAAVAGVRVIIMNQRDPPDTCAHGGCFDFFRPVSRTSLNQATTTSLKTPHRAVRNGRASSWLRLRDADTTLVPSK